MAKQAKQRKAGDAGQSGANHSRQRNAQQRGEATRRAAQQARQIEGLAQQNHSKQFIADNRSVRRLICTQIINNIEKETK